MASASLAPFRSRSFTLMWIGALLSNTGTWMESVGLSYYVAHTTGMASWTALVAAAGFLPNGVLGPIGSAMADRWNRRRVLVIGNFLAAVVAAILAVWVGGGTATPLGIAGLSFVAGCISAFSWPSFQTSLPDLVPREHLVAAIGLSSAQWNMGRIVGPAFAAVAISLGGIGAALWCNAISFFAVIIALGFIRLPQRSSEHRRVFGALADGVRFARTNPAMRRMIAMMMLTVLVASPFIALVPQVATSVFHGDAKTTSAFVTAQGIGAVAAAFTLGSLSRRFGLDRVLVGAVALLCPALVVYGVSPALWLAAVMLVFVGWFYGYAFVSFSSIAQRSAPDAMRGRVLAVNFLVLGVLFPVGSLIQGRIADAVGLRWTTAGSGLVLALGVVALLPMFRGEVWAPSAVLTAPSSVADGVP